MLPGLIRDLAAEGSVLDVGCHGFKLVGLAGTVGQPNLKHSGVDYIDRTFGAPAGFVFRKADLNITAIPFEDDSFDLVVASHVMEHVFNPVELFADLVRVCKPGGRIYLEAPSERSLLLPSMPFIDDGMYTLSFFDDPTHFSRPWTPMAFYKLARYFGCEPEEVRHNVSCKKRVLFPFVLVYALLTRSPRLLETWSWPAVGWTCSAVVRKPSGLSGAPEYRYFIPTR